VSRKERKRKEAMQPAATKIFSVVNLRRRSIVLCVLFCHSRQIRLRICFSLTNPQ
jgi:hypothetical protein